MNYTDLHCDTLFEAYKRKCSLVHSSLCGVISHNPYERANQVLAIWSDYRLSEDEAYERFFGILSYFSSRKYELPDNFGYILAVEGASLLKDDLSRLDELYLAGVRILTPMWKDENRVGGAWNCQKGLTDFGRQTIKKCFGLGIIPDISHASKKSADEILGIAENQGKSVICSHSDSYSVHPHPRNITDEAFRRVMKLGGVVGISLMPSHLCEGRCDSESVIKHIMHYLSLGGENTVCFGCDYDGIEKTPEELENASKLCLLEEKLKKQGVGGSTVEKLFYKNAESFFGRNGIPFESTR